jgi:hypothetical protein
MGNPKYSQPAPGTVLAWVVNGTTAEVPPLSRGSEGKRRTGD